VKLTVKALNNCQKGGHVMALEARTIELDVRPHLRKKLEPFQLIMDTVKSLKKADTFILHATFKPTPLLGLMKTKGYRNHVEQLEADHWTVTFTHKSQKLELDPASLTDVSLTDSQDESSSDFNAGTQTYKLDNRGLEPPQPMIRTLKKLEQAKSGDIVIIHNDRVPMFLIEELNTLGYTFSVADQPDGSAIVTIHKT
jgi:TusA-related sulfurtransferase